jgi:hypothetical protein
LNLIGVLGLEHLLDGLGKGLDFELEFGEEGVVGFILGLSGLFWEVRCGLFLHLVFSYIIASC